MILTKKQALKWGVQGSRIFSVTWSRGALRAKTARLPLQGDSPACWTLNPGELLLRCSWETHMGGEQVYLCEPCLQTRCICSTHSFSLPLVLEASNYSGRATARSLSQSWSVSIHGLRGWPGWGDERVKKKTHTQQPGSSERLLYRAEPRYGNYCVQWKKTD